MFLDLFWVFCSNAWCHLKEGASKYLEHNTPSVDAPRKTQNAERERERVWGGHLIQPFRSADIPSADSENHLVGLV